MATARTQTQLAAAAERRRRLLRQSLQRPGQPVDVAVWNAIRDADGTRQGKWLTSPADVDFGFLRSGREYLFKQSISRAPEQFWNEIFAYRLAECIGIGVPPTHAAFNSVTGEAGALSESFLNSSLANYERYIPGFTLVCTTFTNTERRKRKVHAFDAILDWIRFLERNRLSRDDWREHWSRALLLDSLLGNTDRHPGNWGAIFTITPAGKTNVRPAPLFDNGTSLGYEQNASRIHLLNEPSRLQRYIYRGTHQMFWRRGDAALLSHPDFLKKFADEFPRYRTSLLSRLRISDKTIDRILSELVAFQGSQRLSEERALLMARLTKHRRDLLLRVLK